ncbi:uncharacterized protein Z518_00132 [Rhinocladiella mackenziei CBS 650.93]|uniref:Uncharacterized protein n=1 Tax=Rhinocladiella mackenziei CBS 650.93 TaxID=1442369 RepID=A0A0D2ISV5_9EURO|nr:uncharacterized protein Z518_00132 [Rhinocladiella mackenziei CBS 650.93]KIX09054.1 hypothetical protein Z518_00132 [Rhinocladiella mackenziei CBS 650.93]
MALIRGTMSSPDNTTVFATCEHHKVNVPARSAHLSLREELRNEIAKRGGREWLDEGVEELIKSRRDRRNRVESGTVKL